MNKIVKKALILVLFPFLIYNKKFRKVFFKTLKELKFILNANNFIVVALILLGLCPFLLIFRYDLLAERFAVYAYYFLVLGVVLRIIEFILENKKNTRD